MLFALERLRCSIDFNAVNSTWQLLKKSTGSIFVTCDAKLYQHSRVYCSGGIVRSSLPSANWSAIKNEWLLKHDLLTLVILGDRTPKSCGLPCNLRSLKCKQGFILPLTRTLVLCQNLDQTWNGSRYEGSCALMGQFLLTSRFLQPKDVANRDINSSETKMTFLILLKGFLLLSGSIA